MAALGYTPLPSGHTAPIRLPRVCVLSFGETDKKIGFTRVAGQGRLDSHFTGSFKSCKTAIAKLVTQVHRDESKRLCIYTDSRDTHWS